MTSSFLPSRCHFFAGSKTEPVEANAFRNRAQLVIGAMQRRLLEIDPDFSPPPATDKPDQKLLSDVESVGWHVLKIFASDDQPQFAFSVGLYYTFGHPEILVMGLKPDVAHQFINLIGQHIAGGKRFQEGERTNDLAVGFECVFLPVSLDHYEEYLGYGIWFYRKLKAPFPVLQFVWPDKQGRFPWETGFDERFNALQRVLSDHTPSA